MRKLFVNNKIDFIIALTIVLVCVFSLPRSISGDYHYDFSVFLSLGLPVLLGFGSRSYIGRCSIMDDGSGCHLEYYFGYIVGLIIVGLVYYFASRLIRKAYNYFKK